MTLTRLFVLGLVLLGLGACATQDDTELHVRGGVTLIAPGGTIKSSTPNLLEYQSGTQKVVVRDARLYYNDVDYGEVGAGDVIRLRSSGEMTVNSRRVYPVEEGR